MLLFNFVYANAQYFSKACGTFMNDTAKLAKYIQLLLASCKAAGLWHYEYGSTPVWRPAVWLLLWKRAKRDKLHVKKPALLLARTLCDR